MNVHTKRAATVFAAALLSVAVAQAAGVRTAKNGMTVYTYDKDKGSVPSCYGFCADFWPPYLATKGDKAGKHWSLVKRKNGDLQWTYQGKPLYFYASDKKQGDMKGDGSGHVWHVIKG